MAERLLAIGDIHGCSQALAALVKAIDLRSDDTLVVLGDYIDRGPDSRGVIELLLSLRERCQLVALLGNHEEMMLRTMQREAPAEWWLRHGGRETLASYGCDNPKGSAADFEQIPVEHLAFLESCVSFHETEDFFFVHANYVAGETLFDQPVEALRWQSLGEHFPTKHVSGRTAIVGHTAQRTGEVLDAGHVRCLDTYCYGGGWLTAMEVRESRVWQANVAGRLRGD